MWALARPFLGASRNLCLVKVQNCVARSSHISSAKLRNGCKAVMAINRGQPLRLSVVRSMCQVAEKKAQSQRKFNYKAVTYYILSLSVGVGAVAYILSHLSIRLTKYFSKVTFVDSWKFGVFTGGFLAGTSMFGLGLLCKRFVSISPDRVFHQSMRYLAASPVVRDHLGQDLHVGMFKAYSYEPRVAMAKSWRSRDFGVSVSSSDVQAIANTEESSFRSRFFKSSSTSHSQPAGSLRMLYQVSGGKRDAMVSVDAYQQLFGRKIVVSSLAVTDTTGHCVVLLGKPTDVFYQGRVSLR